MRNQNMPFVIVSCFDSNRSSEANEKEHNSILSTLKTIGRPFFEVIGCYKGIKEKSIVVHLDNFNTANTIAQLNRQDSILIVHSDNTAELEFCKTGTRVKIGTWRNCTKQEAESSDAYTYVPDTDKYFKVF